ncbi:DUF6221 family protein [Streptomyces zaomyceticus]|uniref:DUF6221 family protein n=1 Tax=Streptomyces zaomyceticus TaxID=68286 RepID=UPI0036A27787
MDDLIAFLRARLDEDEQTARAVGFSRIETAEYLWGSQYLLLQRDEGESKVTAELDAPLSQHIARHDPARVLAEVEAKRQIIKQHERYAAERRRMMGGWDPQSDDSPILAALATVYADHPDYRDEWRP